MFTYHTPKNDPTVAILRIEDFPDIDVDTEDGREVITYYAFTLLSRNSKFFRVLIMRGGEQIAEILDGGNPLEERH
jgi:hypothetical protein